PRRRHHRVPARGARPAPALGRVVDPRRHRPRGPAPARARRRDARRHPHRTGRARARAAVAFPHMSGATMTPRLYYDDPLLLSFRARVVGHAAWNGAASLLLDRTAFYPESGGQMSDRGMLAGVAVTDVQVDDAGLVHHVVAGPLPAVGDEIDATIDRERRRV